MRGFGRFRIHLDRPNPLILSFSPSVRGRRNAARTLRIRLFSPRTIGESTIFQSEASELSNWKDQQVLIVGGGIGGLAAALALGAQGYSLAAHRTGVGVQGNRRRHPARAQCVLDVRGARPDRADQRARRLSQQPHHDGFGDRAGGHAHSARRCFPQEIPSSLCADPSRRFAQGAAASLPEIRSDPPRRLAESRQGR